MMRDLPQVETPSILEDIPAPSSSQDQVPTREGVNYNITKSLTKTVSRSSTYVPDGTDSIDEYYQDLGLGSIYTQDSCIKKKTEGSPPGANAQDGTDFDEAIDIIEEYNRAMDIHFNPGDKEISNVLEKLNELRKVRKYFNSTILNKIWNDYSDSYTKSYKNRRISGFIKCSLVEQLSKYGPLIMKANDEEIDQLLDGIFMNYGDQISSIIENEGYYLSYGSLEPIDASKHFPPQRAP